MLKLNVVLQNTPLLTSYALSTRLLGTKSFNQSLELFTNSKTPITLSGNGPFQLNINEERPLTIILAWLMSQRKHIHKYAKYYLDNGFDVLTVKTTPWQLLWPVSGSHVCLVFFDFFILNFIISRWLLMTF